MDIRGKNILMLGGSGLVGIAIARKLLPLHPARLVIAALRREEAEEGIDTLQSSTDAEGVELLAEIGVDLLTATWEILLELAPWLLLGLTVAAGLFVWQQWLIRNRDEAACFKAFLNNQWVGAAVFAGIALDYTFAAG